ncbi:flagellar export protein FliJ [Desulfolucanica intricata]|uniref:flagellar export protein FliJ n=1 Tax=Desulfolucanica intricata TaxID=1285191 RepID=UPI0008336B1E|nr:flagellar export protein FliJ [Desulfolucanica intricata]
MARFRFGLEQVLKHRKMEEKQAEDALALARRRHFQIMNSLEEARLVLQQHLNTENEVGKIDCCQSIHGANYREYLNTKIIKLQEKAVSASEKIKEKQKIFVDARQKSLVLEKLKQKKLEEFIYLENIQEQKQIDDLAITMYIRNKN